ncbi:CNNM domain-containing protein [Phytoactinopolyspora halotolerans]|uniref:HlyC/CorC family transporter n=1 Tax=Phytoactinopolyspora halotolerans TaxID=1981512 RepID=A0A6L9SAZ3_9ACTN|nr:hemolysin family protein [Phytoactinopolyspora halotolerans]NEE01678.1 HlyC/CorC family transporter [Phytoactinopolyspora halotolerans]
MSAGTALLVTGLLFVASGFFVAAEFALVGAARHRLEQAVADKKRGARAALNGVRELSLMLAGAQLGITMVMIGLGMVSEPALHHLLEPPMSALGMPHAAADVAALVLALAIVTFLHVVVGEMAPKSWAIAHPERSAMMLGPAFRFYAAIVRFVLVALNGLTNVLVRLVRVQPRDEVVTVRNREQIHQLVSESQRLGLVSDEQHGLLTRALGGPGAAVGQVMVPLDRVVSVGADAGPQDVLDIATQRRHTRLVVRDASGTIIGAVHAREALAGRGVDAAWSAGAMARPIPSVSVDADLATAAEVLRRNRAQLGVVRDGAQREVGMVTMDDLVTKILVSA